MSELEKLQHPFEKRAVDVEPQDGKWIVRVIEAGREETVEFDIQKNAETFAAGQRMRLKLDGTNE